MNIKHNKDSGPRNSLALTAAVSGCTTTTNVMTITNSAPLIVTQSCQQQLCITRVKIQQPCRHAPVSTATSGDSCRMTAATSSISTATQAPSTTTQSRQNELRTATDTLSNRGYHPVASEIARHQQLHTAEESLQQAVVQQRQLRHAQLCHSISVSTATRIRNYDRRGSNSCISTATSLMVTMSMTQQCQH